MADRSRADTLAFGLVVLVAVLSSTISAQAFVGNDGKEKAKPQTYDEKADAKADIAAALAKAGKDNKRVLLMFGANWCGWCHLLHGVFDDNREIAKVLLYEYELVTVDIGRMDKHLDLAKKYGADLKQGVPFLTVLDADGKPLVNQETSSLEAGDHHDPAKVKAFLDRWKAKKLDAQKELDRALAQAAKQKKTVFVSFGAPWCQWCHHLEDFLAQPEIAKIMDRDFVMLKIDVDRMDQAEEVVKRFEPSEGDGLPWMVLIDAKGSPLITSFGPKGNVGYPAYPFEIAHFVSMLKKGKKNISDADLAKIERGLQKEAEALLQG